jgi:CheY-like chemotaxis protein
MPNPIEPRESPQVADGDPTDPVILVAEDDDTLRAYMVEALMEVGYRVVPAGNGNEAVAALRLRQVDLLVTDLIMPEQDGLETILHVRRYFPNLKVVAISGASPTYLRVARALGARAVLLKPFSAGDLVGTVECVLQHGLRPESETPGTKGVRG